MVGLCWVGLCCALEDVSHDAISHHRSVPDPVGRMRSRAQGGAAGGIGCCAAAGTAVPWLRIREDRRHPDDPSKGAAEVWGPSVRRRAGMDQERMRDPRGGERSDILEHGANREP